MTGAGVRIEIPSVEHPRLLEVVLTEADRRGVRIDRISQGSGLQFLTAAELDEMLKMAHGESVDVYLFTSVRNSFDPLADPTAGDQVRGEAAYQVPDVNISFCQGVGGMHAAAGTIIFTNEEPHA